MDVLDLSGPEFLKFYIPLLIFSLVGAWLIRWYLRQPGGEIDPGDEAGLLPEQVAYLAGGPKRLVDATIAGLAHSHQLEVAGVAPPRLTTALALDASATPLQRAVYGAVESAGPVGQTISTVRQRVAPLAESLIDPLRDRGYVMTPGALLIARVGTATVPALCLLLGITKIAVGVARDKPVGYLVVLSMLALFGTILLVTRCSIRTRRGDSLLRALERRGAALRSTATAAGDTLATPDMMMAFALFGPALLATGPLSDLHKAFQPPQSGGSGCGGSSGCGSSSCGGSGCGGGGCGGCGGD